MEKKTLSACYSARLARRIDKFRNWIDWGIFASYWRIQVRCTKHERHVDHIAYRVPLDSSKPLNLKRHHLLRYPIKTNCGKICCSNKQAWGPRFPEGASQVAGVVCARMHSSNCLLQTTLSTMSKLLRYLIIKLSWNLWLSTNIKAHVFLPVFSGGFPDFSPSSLRGHFIGCRFTPSKGIFDR